ncbi:MAG: hypothetical protein K2H43_01880, partial [Clostridia bacterium]|nr:hypothetical protein [Clostridia bacterium]
MRYGNDGVFLNWGDLKLKTTVEELMELIGRFLPEGDGNADLSASIDTDAILADLVKNDLVIGGGEAELSAELNILGFILPVDFRFLVDENNGVTLGDVTAKLVLGDFEIGAMLAFGEEEIPALSEAEKSEYVGFVPYAERVVDLLGADALSVSLDYSAENFTVAGNVNIALKDGIKAQG